MCYLLSPYRRVKMTSTCERLTVRAVPVHRDLSALRRYLSYLGGLSATLVRLHTAPILALTGPALGTRLPGDQDFAAGWNVARDEALGARSEELVEARLQN